MKTFEDILKGITVSMDEGITLVDFSNVDHCEKEHSKDVANLNLFVNNILGQLYGEGISDFINDVKSFGKLRRLLKDPDTNWLSVICSAAYCTYYGIDLDVVESPLRIEKHIYKICWNVFDDFCSEYESNIILV